jgi:hypothetical protein
LRPAIVNVCGAAALLVEQEGEASACRKSPAGSIFFLALAALGLNLSSTQTGRLVPASRHGPVSRLLAPRTAGVETQMKNALCNQRRTCFVEPLRETKYVLDNLIPL